VYVVV
jgi:hypothetical protein